MNHFDESERDYYGCEEQLNDEARRDHERYEAEDAAAALFEERHECWEANFQNEVSWEVFEAECESGAR